ncbi:Gfo/Idh/MocA family protein [Actinomadura sp. 6N118]|uniref:Gfo/Idh/MocA family protein n=1 Tax=Actinomadura sp. 6N118 TaxID=3375151 RepID=UPI0037AE1147
MGTSADGPSTGRRLRVAMVGLGDIAQKAYLPVLGALPDIDLRLHTRNADKLRRIAEAHRIPSWTTDLDELLAAGLDAAFIHTATASHVSLAERLLKAGVHVYVDKPLDYHLKGAERLAGLAERFGRSLMVGFNRRHAPGYVELLKQPRDLIVMQKNRKDLAGDVRTVIFDDFIHVVDTLRFLLPGEITHMDVRAKVRDGLLFHVLLQLSGNGHTAIGIMNRDSGSTEEVCEVMGDGRKSQVLDLADVIDHKGSQIRTRRPDWDPVARQRGIEQSCARFLDAVRAGTTLSPADALLTHRMCEEIITIIEARGEKGS